MNKFLTKALAGLLGIAMLFTSSIGVRAAEGAPLGGTSSVSKLVWGEYCAGTNRDWFYKPDLTLAEDKKAIVRYTIEQNGKPHTSTTLYVMDKADLVYSYYLPENGFGTYEISMEFFEVDESIPDQDCVDGTYCKPENRIGDLIKATKVYESAPTQLERPTNFSWSDEGYVLSWDGGSEELCGGYQVKYELYVYNSVLSSGSWSGQGGNIKEDHDNQFNFADALMRLGFPEYFEVQKLKASVRFLSKDPTACASSQWVEAPILNLVEIEDDVKSKIDSIIENTPEAIAQVFDTPEKMDALMVNMATDTAVESRIDAIESSYVNTNSITVASDTSAANELFATTPAISMVGAGLNARANDQVTLKVSKTASEVAVENRYINPVQIDIKLLINDTNRTGNLTVPITITMPIPKGVEKAGLIISHVHGDGTREDIRNVRFNNDGTITFAVRNFSTFIFANVKAADMDSNTNTNDEAEEIPADEDRERIINAIEVAALGDKKVEIFDVDTLSYDEMKKLSENPSVTLIMNYTYGGKDYRVTILGRNAVPDLSIPWYGPLYLAGIYGNGGKAPGSDKTPDTGNGEQYLIKSGDTLSSIAVKNGTTIARLLSLNPYIKNKDLIYSGKQITIR